MAGISKAERERRAAEAAAAGTAPDPSDAGTEDATSATTGADQDDSGGAGDTDQAGEQLQDAGPALVHMTRDASAHPAPHTADVHPAEVGNFAAGGWQLASD